MADSAQPRPQMEYNFVGTARILLGPAAGTRLPPLLQSGMMKSPRGATIATSSWVSIGALVGLLVNVLNASRGRFFGAEFIGVKAS